MAISIECLLSYLPEWDHQWSYLLGPSISFSRTLHISLFLSKAILLVSSSNWRLTAHSFERSLPTFHALAKERAHLPCNPTFYTEWWHLLREKVVTSTSREMSSTSLIPETLTRDWRIFSYINVALTRSTFLIETTFAFPFTKVHFSSFLFHLIFHYIHAFLMWDLHLFHCFCKTVKVVISLISSRTFFKSAGSATITSEKISPSSCPFSFTCFNSIHRFCTSFFKCSFVPCIALISILSRGLIQSTTLLDNIQAFIHFFLGNYNQFFEFCFWCACHLDSCRIMQDYETH